MERSYADLYEPSRWQRARRRFKSFGLWLWGAIGLGGILAAYFSSVATELLPAPRDLVCLAKEQLRAPSPGTHFTILISDLADDSDGRQTNLVRDVFLNQRGLDVRRTCRIVTLDSAGGSLADAEAAATVAGRALLDDWNADILIWGEVIEQNKELHLWFLTREEGAGIRQPSYSLTERISLPIDFQEDIAEKIEAVAFSRIKLNEDQLDSTLEKLRHLISGASDGALRPRRTAFLYAFGRAAAERGARDLDRDWLEEAVVAYHEALQRWTRERVPLGWAAVQQSLAQALATLAFVEGDVRRFEQALASYGESLAEWTKEQVSPRSMEIGRNIGMTLAALGSLQYDPARYAEAAAYYHEVLDKLTLDQAPTDWAATQAALGDVLAQRGVLQLAPAPLEESMVAYREALKVWTRYQWPVQWAETQRKIGDALSVIGQLLDDAAILQEAQVAYESALQVAGRDRAPLVWAATQVGLAQLLLATEEWNRVMVRLEEGLNAQHKVLNNPDLERYELALTMLQFNISTMMLLSATDNIELLEHTVVSMRDSRGTEEPIPWVRATNHLAMALALDALGRFKGDGSSLKLAVAELRTVLEDVTPERAPGPWATTQVALGTVLTHMGEMQIEPVQLSEAVAAHRQGLRILTRARTPLLWSYASAGLGAALSALGWQESESNILREAVATFEELEPELRGWGQLQRTMYYYELGKAWTRLGELERDSEGLHTGIRACARALQRVPQTHLPIHWAITQNCLVHATLAFAEQEQGAVPLALLEEQIGVLRGALDVFRAAGAEYYIADTEADLARAEALLAQRRGSSAAE